MARKEKVQVLGGALAPARATTSAAFDAATAATTTVAAARNIPAVALEIVTRRQIVCDMCDIVVLKSN